MDLLLGLTADREEPPVYCGNITKVEHGIVQEINQAEIYQLSIILIDISPPIWRRILVPSDMTLERLHRVIQKALSWYDSPLHAFVIQETHYGMPGSDWLYDVQDEAAVKLNQVVTGPGMVFEYDFDYDEENDWRHEIVVEEVRQPQAGVQYPVCIGGARSRPPKDCGGWMEYMKLLERIARPGFFTPEEILDAVGEGFDSEAFDMDAVNLSLRRIT